MLDTRHLFKHLFLLFLEENQFYIDFAFSILKKGKSLSLIELSFITFFTYLAICQVVFTICQLCPKFKKKSAVKSVNY